MYRQWMESEDSLWFALNTRLLVCDTLNRRVSPYMHANARKGMHYSNLGKEVLCKR